MQPEVEVQTGSKKTEEVDLVDDSNSIEALDESTKDTPVDSADDAAVDAIIDTAVEAAVPLRAELVAHHGHHHLHPHGVHTLLGAPHDVPSTTLIGRVRPIRNYS